MKISDGGDNASTRSLAEVIDMAKRSTAVVDVIGVFDEKDGDEHPAVLRRFANKPPGKAVFPQSSRDISQIYAKIARDTRNQYTLAYIPVNALQDGRYRAVDVEASAPGLGSLSVSTRAGYSVPVNFSNIGSKGTQP